MSVRSEVHAVPSLTGPSLTDASPTGPSLTDASPTGPSLTDASPTGPSLTAARALARSHRAIAREHGAIVALSRLHTSLSPGVLPAGPGGHVLVPSEVAAVCDDYETPDGPRTRAGTDQKRLATIPVAGRELTALRIVGAGPAGGPGAVSGWQAGLGWYRLGLAERLLSQAVAFLRARSSGGTALIDLTLVRATLADAASGTAEACALLDSGFRPTATAASLRQAHRTLDEVGRHCLLLFGATGFLVDGPGSEIRASELLSDTYAPPAERQAPPDDWEGP